MSVSSQFRPFRNRDKNLLLTNLEDVVESYSLEEYLDTYKRVLSVGVENVVYFSSVKNFKPINESDYNRVNSEYGRFYNQFVLVQECYLSLRDAGINVECSDFSSYEDFSFPAFILLIGFNGLNKAQRKEIFELGSRF